MVVVVDDVAYDMGSIPVTPRTMIDEVQLRGISYDKSSTSVCINSVLVAPSTPKTFIGDGSQMLVSSVGGAKVIGVVPPNTPNNMVDGVEYLRFQQKRRKINIINTLVDELLVEILCRLSCQKNVAICKVVCKHWAALLSNPFFITRFIAYKVGKHTYGNEYDQAKMTTRNDRKFGVVVRMICGKNTWKGLMIHFNDPIHKPNKLSLYYLPRLSNGGLPRKLTIVGACNDLMLYQRHVGRPHYDKLKLYISNAQSRQWLALPSLHLNNRPGTIGLICDPYYSSHSGNVTLNNAYHACIVVIPYAREVVTEFPAHILSSNTGGIWRNVLLSLPLRCRLLSTSGAFCIGRKFYFHCVDALNWSPTDGRAPRLISFDPFVDNDVIKCSSLPLPPSLVSLVSFFDVFHDRLHMCDREDDGRYRIWVLEDHEIGKWSLRHSIMGGDWIPRDPRLAKLVTQDPCFGDGIGFHPVIPDIIYVLCDRWIVLCNLSTRKMEIVSELPKGCRGIFPLARPFQITVPFWQTPLPTFVHEGNL